MRYLIRLCNNSYVEWHLEAERRHKRGERQVQCEACGLWVFDGWPEDVAEHLAKNGHEFKPAFISFSRRSKG